MHFILNAIFSISYGQRKMNTTNDMDVVPYPFQMLLYLDDSLNIESNLYILLGKECPLYQAEKAYSLPLRCQTYLPLVSHTCGSESGHHWFRQCFVVYSAPSHYLNQYWAIVNWTLRNKLLWIFFQNTKKVSFTKLHQNYRLWDGGYFVHVETR